LTIAHPSTGMPSATFEELRACSDRSLGESPFGKSRHHKAGTLLYGQGELLSTLYLIVAGVVKLSRTNSADRSIVVGLRSKGWLLGVPSFILGQTSPVAAEALTNTTTRPLEARALATARQSDPTIDAWLATLLAGEVVKHLEAQDMSLLGARQRLLRIVLSLAGACPLATQPDGSYVIPVRLSHRELADLLKTSRETASRLIGDLARSSLLSIERTEIVIPPRSYLAGQIRLLGSKASLFAAVDFR
jgi:CRP/FNR family transcriptional regulator, cyclic AMP receptor protein